MRATARAAAWRAALVVAVCLCAGVGVGRAQSVPSPWSTRDVGGPVLAGTSTYSNGEFTVDAAGIDIWDRSDQFHFVYQAVSGDADVRARVDAVSMAHAWSKAGVMIRASLAADAPHGYALLSAAKGVAFQRRTVSGGLSTHTAGPAATPPGWVRLVREGTRLTAYTSGDGVRWTAIATDTVSLGTTAYIGIAVTSHRADARTTARVSNVAVSSTALPPGQSAADVGSPTIAGRASFIGGQYTVRAAGADIWDSADQFHYVYQPVAGDVDVTVRVASITAAHPWSKAGVMIRESLSPGSRHAMSLVSAGKGYAFQRRVDPGAWSIHASGGAGAPPGWVRLRRTGSLFEAYRSADGLNWTKIGDEFIAMADTVYVGIAVSSHNVDLATVAVADNFRIAGASAPAAEQPAAEEPPADGPPRAVVFEASADHATLVTMYVLEIFRSGDTPGVALPVVTSDLGKPAVAINGEITVDRSELFLALAPGDYLATVTAVGTTGSARSEAATFSR